jgi:hypothetical protein
VKSAFGAKDEHEEVSFSNSDYAVTEVARGGPSSRGSPVACEALMVEAPAVVACCNDPYGTSDP